MRIRCNDDTLGRFRFIQQPSRQNKSHWRMWLTLCFALFVASGCSASVRVQPSVAGYAVAPASQMPLTMDGYPRYFFRGRYAYLIDGQWYYPTNDGWVVFLDVPAPLFDYQTRVQSAPPARRAPDVYYGYPPPQPPPRQPTPPRELQREYRPQ